MPPPPHNRSLHPGNKVQSPEDSYFLALRSVPLALESRCDKCNCTDPLASYRKLRVDPHQAQQVQDPHRVRDSGQGLHRDLAQRQAMHRDWDQDLDRVMGQAMDPARDQGWHLAKHRD